MNKALLMVDLQNDFMPMGSLPVPRGNEIIPLANKLQNFFKIVVASQDWHPQDHGSFASNHPNHQPGDVIMLDNLPQVLWPNHCVENTYGADFVKSLDTTRVHIIKKGNDKTVDSYSAFFDNGHRIDTGLNTYLRSHGIEVLYVLGVATDYCVKYSVLDACALGYRTVVIEDACRGIDLHPGDIKRALEEMVKAGAIIIQSQEVQ